MAGSRRRAGRTGVAAAARWEETAGRAPLDPDGSLPSQSGLYLSLLESTVRESACLRLDFQVAGEHKYHPECFVCLSCKVVIEDRDTYALVERSKLYW